MATLSPPLSPQQSRSDRSEKPRAVTAMSHTSTHSHRTTKSREEKKLELTENTRDKRRLEGKSDPTKALHEAQPAAVALEDATNENIRDVQHKDREGNLIIDPDRSNPTRPRMERPLDTIRSFNAAAEGTTSRRSSYQRPPTNSGWDAQSRRSSYYGPPNNGVYPPNGRQGPRPIPGQGGYYRNSSYGHRPDIFAEEGGPVQQAPPRQQGRHQAAPYGTQIGESPNSLHSNQHSYETMTSGSEEMSKSTNPSSQNSSFDQLHQMGMRKQENGYESNPYRQHGASMRPLFAPPLMQNGHGGRPVRPTDDYGIEFSDHTSAPPPPPKQLNDVGREMPNSNLNSGRLQKTGSNAQKEPSKRQSWIKRTFSKRG